MSKPLMLWRVGWGRISRKPIRCLDLGAGWIKVTGSPWCRQPRDGKDGRGESYHDTRAQAIARLLADADSELETARRNFANTTRRVKKLRAKFGGESA